MTDPHVLRTESAGSQGTDGRRRQLRLLLLSAADAARRSRRVTNQMAGRMGRPMGRAIRERVSTLLRAAS